MNWRGLLILVLISALGLLAACHLIGTGENIFEAIAHSTTNGGLLSVIAVFVSLTYAVVHGYRTWLRPRAPVWVSIIRVLVGVMMAVALELYIHRRLDMPVAGYVVIFLVILLMLNSIVYDVYSIELMRRWKNRGGIDDAK